MEYNKGRVDTRTNSLAFFDKYQMMLKIQFYNDNISITFTKGADMNGKTVWAKENSKSVLITKERVAALHSCIMTDILELIDSKKNGARSVFLTKDYTSALSVGVEDGNVFIEACSGISTESRIPESVTRFEFPKTHYLKDYNPKSGEYEMMEAEAVFTLFTKSLEAFLLNIAGSACHMNRIYERYQNQKVIEYLESIGTKLGCITPVASNMGSLPFTPTNQNTNMEAITPMAGSDIETTDLSSIL